MFSRVAVATAAAVLILAAPAAASTAAAGPSPTPLILELVLAAVVMTGMAVRRPVSRAFSSFRGKLAGPRATRGRVERRAASNFNCGIEGGRPDCRCISSTARRPPRRR